MTGSQLVLFDPHTDILGVSASNPGMRSDFVKSQLLRTMPDQCKPYQAFGCNMKQAFSGTLFRLPLRSAAQASRSRLSQQVSISQFLVIKQALLESGQCRPPSLPLCSLVFNLGSELGPLKRACILASKLSGRLPASCQFLGAPASVQVYTQDTVTKLFNALREEAEDMLLFLKNVESLEIYTWAPDAPKPTLNFSCSIQNITDPIRAARSTLASADQVLTFL